MPKRKRSKKKKLHLDEASQLMIKLDEVARSGSKDAAPARSLVDWFMANKSWTVKQWSYARSICTRFKRNAKPKSVKKFYLYAISDGLSVKLGYSSNVKSRISAMQTGCPNTLKCQWKYYVGKSEGEAKRMEGKLHRYCKKYRKRGEWFHADCMVLVEQFSIKQKMTDIHNEEEAELEILAEARDRI